MKISDNCQSCPYINEIYVPPIKNPSAKIVIVGESPGNEERLQLKPFVGGSGRMLRWMMYHAGLSYDDCAVTNCVLCYPADKTFLGTAACYCKPNLIDFLKLDKSPRNARVAIAVGDLALKMLTNKEHILKHRGSVIWSDLTNLKVIPILHPAFIMRGMQHYKYINIADLERIKKEAEFPHIIRDKENFAFPATLEDIDDFFNQVFEQRLTVSLDVENIGDVLLCIGLGHADKTICIPFFSLDYKSSQHFYTLTEVQHIVELLVTLFSSKLPLIGQTIITDLTKLSKFGFEFNNIIEDTMIAHSVLAFDFPHNLGFISSIYANTPFYKDDPKNEAYSSYSGLVSDSTLMEYNSRDVNVTYISMQSIKEDLQESGQLHIYNILKANILPVLWMTQNGVYIDATKHAEVLNKYQNINIDSKQELLKIIGEAINPNSYEQLSHFIFDELQMTPPARTKRLKKGYYSVEEDVIIKMREETEHPIFQSILDYRKSRKILTELKEQLLPGIVRAWWRINGTITGRFSCKDPNLQQTTLLVREMIVPRHPGWKMVSVDWKQLEMRIQAIEAGDEVLLEACRTGDPHTQNASELLGKPPSEITLGERHYAKAFIYALLYGSTVDTIMNFRGHGTSEISRDRSLVATQWQRWFKAHPKVLLSRDKRKKEAFSTKRLRLPLGRIIHFYKELSPGALERAAYDYPMQGTAADMMNTRFPEICDTIKRLGGLLTMQLHDSVLFEAPENSSTEIAETVKSIMERPFEELQNNSFDADISIGDNWKEVT